MIPGYYEFNNRVKMIAGMNALSSLPSELLKTGVTKPIVITDKGVLSAGLMAHVEKALEGSKVNIGAVFDDTPVDSSIKAVNRIAEIYREKGCNGILAVGGGSVIDTAKGVNIVISENTDDLLKFAGNNRVRAHMQPFAVIPTTAGTGSEVTMAAVIANPDLNVKMQFTTPLMLPDFTLVDPEMTKTMPPRITAMTGMDALTHAIECFMSLQRNPISDAFAHQSIELIRENLLTAVVNGEDQDARFAMGNAALLAGVAFANAMTGIVHAMAHALGGVCHIPHGLANAIMLPHGMRFNLPKAHEGIGELLLSLAGSSVYQNTEKNKRPLKAIDTVIELNRKLHTACGMPINLKDAGVDKNMFEKVAMAAVNDGASNFNPVSVTFDDAMAILNEAYS